MKYLFLCSLTILIPTALSYCDDFAVEVIEYLPAPGQWVNNPDFNDSLKALGAPVGLDVDRADNTSLVALGAFGGRIVLRFNKTVMDDPRNPMGLDGIVFGNGLWKLRNPYWRWQEPGIIEISRDVNGNGIPDEPWYLIPGSHINYPSINWTSVTYHRTDTAYPPEDKSHYPSQTFFPGYPDFMTFNTILLPDEICGDYENPNYGISNNETVWGYCDLSPVIYDVAGDGEIYLIPDNPYKVGLIPESGGGDAFDIACAIDPLTGEPANLDGFDFIRITSASTLYYSYPFLLDVSTEVDAVSNVKEFDELRGFWKFDIDDIFQEDSGQYGNHGNTAGALHISNGRIGGAYLFNGIDDHILVDEHFTLDIIDDITLECWILLDELPNREAVMIAKGINSTTPEMNYELMIDGDNRLVFRTTNASWHTITADTYFTEDDIGVWRHVAVTGGRFSGNMMLFIDGVCVAVSGWSDRMKLNSHDLTIGARMNSSGVEAGFPGAIDNVRIECVEHPASIMYSRYWDSDGDSDEDCLPDFWEITYFGNLESNQSDDNDGDGKINIHEYKSGTNPVDDSSFFAITEIKYSESGANILFTSLRGWKYWLEYTDEIDNAWMKLFEIIGNGDVISFMDSGDTGRENPGSNEVKKRFYRILAE